MDEIKTTFDKETLEKALPDANEIDKMRDTAEEIGGVKIKPWGFDEAEAILPVLEKILVDLKARKISLRDFIHTEKSTDSEGKERTSVEVINFDQLYFCATRYLRDILKISLHITDKEISNLSPDVSMLIFARIIMQNIGYLKNSLALVVTLTARMGA